LTRICSTEGCGQPLHARGYCSQHYRQWHKANETRRCSVEGCDGRLSARGYCHKHYTRWLKRRKSDARLAPAAEGNDVAVSATRMLPAVPDKDVATDAPTCAGTRPDGSPCSRPVRRVYDYCLLHDPFRSMMRNPKPRLRDAEQLAWETRIEVEAGAEAFAWEGEGRA